MAEINSESVAHVAQTKLSAMIARHPCRVLSAAPDPPALASIPITDSEVCPPVTPHTAHLIDTRLSANSLAVAYFIKAQIIAEGDSRPTGI